MLKALITDDEPENVKGLQAKLNMVCPDVEVVGGYTDAARALQFLSANNEVDLLFLDVEMPGLDGFQLLDALPARHFEVIVVTGHPEYAVQALRHSAIDYLLKPVAFDELRQAVNRVLTRRQQEQQWLQRLDTLAQALKPGRPQTEKLLLHSAREAVMVQLQQVVRISGENNYSVFYLTDGRKITVSKTLGDYEAMLNHQHFFRIHKSHLINLNYLVKLNKVDMLMVHMADGTQIEVSVRRRADLLKALEQIAV